MYMLIYIDDISLVAALNCHECEEDALDGKDVNCGQSNTCKSGNQMCFAKIKCKKSSPQ